MEIVSIVLIFLIAIVILKLVGVIFHAGIVMIALPFKLLALALSGFVVVLVLIPLGVVAGLIGLIALPLAILGPFLPFILIALGLWALLRRR